MLVGNEWPVVIGALVLALSVSGLGLLALWWSTPNPHRALMPAPTDVPGVRYRCWCHNEPIEVLVVPRDVVVQLPSGRHARPSLRAAVRHRMRPRSSSRAGSGGRGEGGIDPAPVLPL